MQSSAGLQYHQENLNKTLKMKQHLKIFLPYAILILSRTIQPYHFKPNLQENLFKAMGSSFGNNIPFNLRASQGYYWPLLAKKEGERGSKDIYQVQG